MVKIMKNLIRMDDLGGFPPIFGNTHVGKYTVRPMDPSWVEGNNLTREPGFWSSKGLVKDGFWS